ncbi:MAG: hypothetical protein Q7J98_11895 [Kiritimatiellia bacterium]|nr:hypothetical protein [Kiritimatiellia bacterium]
MKIMHVLMVLSAAVIMMWTTGCCSTTPRPVTTIKGDLQFTEEITATVTADQAFIMDGKKFKVADVPRQLVKMNTSKDITIIVYPESKMTRATLVELIKTLVQNNYVVSLGARSKYADVPIPRS